jgi:signal transduction histidine kinase
MIRASRTRVGKGRALSIGIGQYHRWPLIAAFGAALAAAVASAAIMLGSMRADALRRASAQLEAVGALKAASVSSWMEVRVLAARYACSYPSAERAARVAAGGRVDRELRSHVDEILRHFAEHWGYTLAALLDGAGHPISVVGRDAARARLPDRWFLEAALADPRRSAARLEVAGDGRATLEVAVATEAGAGALSFCVLRADATAVVEDVVERWPVPSDSGSAALLRAEGGDAALFLPRRERPPEGFVRVPLTRRDRAMVRALRGERGLIEGVDRLGVPILIRARPVQGTEWLLRTRLDRAEVMAPLRGPAAAIATVVVAFLLTGLALLARWRRDDERRAAAEEALRRSRERLELAVAGTHAVWDWDLVDGRLQMEGDLARVLGLPVEGLRGDVPAIVAGFVHADDRRQEVAAVEAHLRGESPVFEAEHRAPGISGELWVRLRGHVVAWDSAGRPARMAGVASDVTERRRLQAQLDLSQRMAGLGRLAAGVAHEINNPLASVIANLAFVGEELPDLPPRVRQALVEAREGAVRVGDVVRGLKTFSRPGPTRRGPVDVARELEAALRLANHELRHRAVLGVRIGDLPRVVADAHELGQVFLNLLVNAAQAVPVGRAEDHRIDVVALTDPRGWAQVEICDSGVGIPPEVLGRIFEPFFTTKPLGVGTGLGLAISHGIVTAAGGVIEVESGVGRGSTFRVLLPPGEALTGPGAPQEVDEKPPEGAERAPARVLVVDDEPLVASAVARALARGYEVTTSTAARDALGRIEAGERFDAVLCDLMMPQMSGMELHSRVAVLAPELASRFVFVTGGAFTDAAADFLRTTTNPWIEKPFDPHALRDLVDRVSAG